MSAKSWGISSLPSLYILGHQPASYESYNIVIVFASKIQSRTLHKISSYCKRGIIGKCQANAQTPNDQACSFTPRINPVISSSQANTVVRPRPIPSSAPSSRFIRILRCVKSSSSTAFPSASRARSIGQGSCIEYFAKDRIGSRWRVRPLRLWKQAFVSLHT